MLDTIYTFLFTPIMSKAFMGLFYGVKPVSIAIIFAVVCAFLIVAVIVLNRLDKTTYYNKECDGTKFNSNDIMEESVLTNLDVTSRNTYTL